tara:strand:- start:1886 stop:2407 length:522 start_codon:yes stop_codon:yes gene_type:complete
MSPKKVIMWSMAVVLLIIGSSIGLNAQSTDLCYFSEKLCVGPTVLEIGTHVFFDRGADDGSLDVFEDGALGLDIQWIGAQAYHNLTDAFKVGINSGIGIIPATTGQVTGSIFSYNLGGFVSLGQMIKFDIGYIKVISANESFIRGQNSDSGIQVGFSFPTVFGDAVERAITGR